MIGEVRELGARSRLPESFSSPDMEFTSRRSPVISRRGMVAASQPLAVAAGLEILAQGGNAADAAVAVAAALNVTEPTSTGLGGDCFALFYDAANRQVTALNGSGRAPGCPDPGAPAPRRLYRRAAPLPCLYHHRPRRLRRLVRPVGALWSPAAERYPGARHPPGGGRLPGDADDRLLLEPGGGAPAAQRSRRAGADHRRPRPAPGEIFRNPGLARTFRAMAEGGKAAFYQGQIAEAIAAVVQQAGGCMAVEDLAAHYQHLGTADQHHLPRHDDLGMPAQRAGAGGPAGLEHAGGLRPGGLPPLSTQRLHLEIEAMRLAFADTRWYVADPAFNPAPLASCSPKTYAMNAAG